MVRLWFLLGTVFLLMFGCIAMEIEQKVERDGSSYIVQKYDVSGFVSYAKQMSQTPGLDTGVEPNADFDISEYSSYENAQGNGILVEITHTSDEDYQAGGYGFISLNIVNQNDYALADVMLWPIESYALVSSSYLPSAAEPIGDIEPMSSQSATKTFQVASVESGKYPAIFLISFNAANNTSKTVVHKAFFDVKEKESVEESLAKFDETMGEACRNATRDDPEVECDYTDGIMTMSKALTPETGEYMFKAESRFPDTYYIFSTEMLPQIGASPLSQDTASLGGAAAAPGIGTGSQKIVFSDPASRVSASSMKMMGMKISYSIEMPGEIVLAENGEIKDGRAVYDAIKLMEDTKMVYVESKELDITMVAAVGLVVLVLIGAVLFFVMRKPPEALKEYSV